MDGWFNLQTLDISMVLSSASCLCTSYFWFIKNRRERAKLEFHQLGNFTVSSREALGNPGFKRVWFQQFRPGSVLIVNQSTRQNSVVIFDCFLATPDGEVAGDWGYVEEDEPPWNVGPESSIAFHPCCAFDVPEDLELPENPSFRIEFITASGQRFSQTFHKYAPIRSKLAQSRAKGNATQSLARAA
ncbi:MAG: hypothetical protein AAFV88_02250 [Planctomycetota bacterium]